ncbi:lipoyl(octanoyl) transferase LipB [Sphingobacterium alkalisoli]|uniref:Octanoyltransferase n=1 Tax=Sphingobacterium alkalisoli TaxID=1874115 RepID=A0A4U0H3D0_9SPHI|nr:lipoyl(octanoyl) transferase LipB [Sphingobacterium alkalisoli]TJY66026.1 lipoyl(octanoyl) transferase LipB [Sphingobacterium alkalisoli]GGH16719.1 octanoyltransferase [Sphingobacterium alkalisoli]
MKQVKLTYLNKGNISYEDALAFQQEVRKIIIELKQLKIDTSANNLLILCEHQPILTFGSSAKESELFIPRGKLSDVGLDHLDIRRGGAITFHGEGQLVGYPILDLENFKTDVRWYIKSIAEVIIQTLNDYGLESYYDEEFPGVWLKDHATAKKKKICAVGVHLSRWVTNHGFAFNINNSLEYYNYFVPCGITQEDRTVTTLQNELNRTIDMEEVKEKILFHFSEVFNTKLIT